MKKLKPYLYSTARSADLLMYSTRYHVNNLIKKAANEAISGFFSPVTTFVGPALSFAFYRSNYKQDALNLLKKSKVAAVTAVPSLLLATAMPFTTSTGGVILTTAFIGAAARGLLGAKDAMVDTYNDLTFSSRYKREANLRNTYRH